MKRRSVSSSAYYGNSAVTKCSTDGVMERSDRSIGILPLLHYSCIPCKESSSPHPYLPPISRNSLRKSIASKPPAQIGFIATSWMDISSITFPSDRRLSASYAKKQSEERRVGKEWRCCWSPSKRHITARYK